MYLYVFVYVRVFILYLCMYITRICKCICICIRAVRRLCTLLEFMHLTLCTTWVYTRVSALYLSLCTLLECALSHTGRAIFGTPFTSRARASHSCHDPWRAWEARARPVKGVPKIAARPVRDSEHSSRMLSITQTYN